MCFVSPTNMCMLSFLQGYEQQLFQTNRTPSLVLDFTITNYFVSNAKTQSNQVSIFAFKCLMLWLWFCAQDDWIWAIRRICTTRAFRFTSDSASVSLASCTKTSLIERPILMWTFNRKLRNNAFGEKLDMSGNISQQLQLVDLENNDISSVTIGSEYKSTLL